MLKIIEHRKIRKLRRDPRQFFQDSKANLYLQEKKRQFNYRRRLRQRFTLIVVVPLLIATGYYLFFATDRYASRSQLIVKGVSSSSSLSLGGLGFLGASTPSTMDAMLVRDFVSSMTMMKNLDSKISLLQHYQSSDADFWARLSSSASKEEALEYFNSRIAIDFDEVSGILSLEAQAFDPKYATKILEAIGQQSEEFLNQINKDLDKEQMSFVQEELLRAQEKLKASKSAMIAFQKKHGLAHPEEQGKAMIAVVNELSAEKTQLEAELKTLLGYMNPKAPQVSGLRNRIRAIVLQLKGENREFSEDGNSLSGLTAAFHELILDFEFAQDAYKTALVSLEKVRIDSSQKKKFLVTVSQPFIPEEARYPMKIKNLITIFFALLVVYGISVLTMEIIKENRD